MGTIEGNEKMKAENRDKDADTRGWGYACEDWFKLGIGGFSRLFHLILVAILVISVFAVASATTTTIQPSNADSHMYKFLSTVNYGSNADIYISPWNGCEKRGIVIFDLSSIPSGAQVTSATLHLHEYSPLGSTRTIGVHRVTSSWTEGGVTWNSRDGTTDWGTAGGDFISTSTDEKSISWIDGSKWDSWDVTSDASAFVSGTYSNYGWIIKDENESADGDFYWQFKSKEHSSSDLRPKLEVIYRLVTSCDVNGNEVNQFAPGESVYVKAEGLAASTSYKIWLQDNPVSEGETLVAGEDDSGAQEDVTTDGSGNFGPTLIWSIPGGAAVTHHEYDIVVDNQVSGTVGTYHAAHDGLDSATVAGIVAPVPDVSSLVLFASGLVLVSVYFVYGRRKKEEVK